MTALSQAAREYIDTLVSEQAAEVGPPSEEYLAELAALIASIRIRRARQAAASGSAGDGDHDAA
jgi:hypothetical protein